jgi:tRNA U34 5-methylaminomethyl-2-thiouridine-forming methyltransferase MnmC
MPIPVRQTYATDREDLLVQVTDDGSRTILKKGGSDAFHSGCGAVSETRHVYLDNSRVAMRLRNRRPTRVLEVGLGSAMAMLMTVDLALIHDAELDYVALETDWIGSTTLELLNPRDWVDCPEIVDSYLLFRDSLPPTVGNGVYVWHFDSRRRVRIHVVDLRDWSNATDPNFDAIYFDPFGPESVPELWTPECFKNMRAVIDPDGRLTTYSCSRPVRVSMEQSGWRIGRVPGPAGGKREVLVASPVWTGLGLIPDP